MGDYKNKSINLSWFNLWISTCYCINLTSVQQAIGNLAPLLCGIKASNVGFFARKWLINTWQNPTEPGILCPIRLVRTVIIPRLVFACRSPQVSGVEGDRRTLIPKPRKCSILSQHSQWRLSSGKLLTLRPVALYKVFLRTVISPLLQKLNVLLQYKSSAFEEGF